MNQPASKEPTMDEILSSIRQIIADDDDNASRGPDAAETAPLAPEPAPKAQVEPEPAQSPAPVAAAIDPFDDDEDDVVQPLALSPDQIVSPHAQEDEQEDEIAAPAYAPEVAAFSPVPEAASVPDPEPEPEPETEMPSEASFQAAADLVVPDDVAFEDPQDRPAPEPERQAPSFAQAAPMPDPDLSADMAEELLEPATQAAVRSAFSKLNTPRITPDMALGANGLTIEAMIREMLRPMLKEWLDENLPSMVERIVTQEIERASRGE